jgi:hypothetical protein
MAGLTPLLVLVGCAPAFAASDAGIMRLHTTDPALDRAFESARHAIEKGLACEGTGCGTLSGDALIATWSAVEYGDFARARTVLESVRDRQREDGAILRETADTPLYILSVWRYVARSGDDDFLRRTWASVEKAYRYCLAAGMASDPKNAYLQRIWSDALGGYAHLASLAGRPAGDAAARLDRARAAAGTARLQWNAADPPVLADFTILDRFAHHETADGLKLLQTIAAGDVAQQLARSAAVIHSAVTGLLGLNGSAIEGTLALGPHLPQGWTVTFDHYRVGTSQISGTIAHPRGEVRVALTIEGGPLAVTLSPAFAAGAAPKSAEVNGAPANARWETTPADAHATIHLPPVKQIESVIRAAEPE